MKLIPFIGLFISVVATANPPTSVLSRAIMFNDIELNGDRLLNPPKDLTYDIKNNYATRKKDGLNYRLSWGKEVIDGQQVTAVTESNIEKDNSIYSRTTTFYDNGLRSSTYCRGSSAEGSAVQTNNLRCVTATRLACLRMVSAFNKEAKQNGVGVGADGVQKLIDKSKECSSLMQSYANIADAITKQNDSMAKQQLKVIDQDQDRLKKHIQEATGGKLLSVTSLKTGSSDEASFNLNKEFLSSMDGLQAMNFQIGACMMNHGSFSAGTWENAQKSTNSNGVKD